MYWNDDTFLLSGFLVLVTFVALTFYAYVLSIMVWHHYRIKQRASKLLAVHGVFEAIFLLLLIIGFLDNVHSLVVFSFAIDVIIVA